MRRLLKKLRCWFIHLPRADYDWKYCDCCHKRYLVRKKQVK